MFTSNFIFDYVLPGSRTKTWRYNDANDIGGIVISLLFTINMK